MRTALVGANLGWHNPSDRGAAGRVPTKVGLYQFMHAHCSGRCQPWLAQPIRSRCRQPCADQGWHNPSDRGAASRVPIKVGTHQKQAAAQVLAGELSGGRTRSRWKK
ncbi:hypothetical protein G6F68_014436 [Rhizopus microsporus]|nr:hypothetical protein G6F68_014436 [Rhizopus microsporus]